MRDYPQKNYIMYIANAFSVLIHGPKMTNLRRNTMAHPSQKVLILRITEALEKTRMRALV
jgi:hypothetical protein